MVTEQAKNPSFEKLEKLKNIISLLPVPTP